MFYSCFTCIYKCSIYIYIYIVTLFLLTYTLHVAKHCIPLTTCRQIVYFTLFICLNALLLLYNIVCFTPTLLVHLYPFHIYICLIYSWFTLAFLLQIYMMLYLQPSLIYMCVCVCVYVYILCFPPPFLYVYMLHSCFPIQYALLLLFLYIYIRFIYIHIYFLLHNILYVFLDIYDAVLVAQPHLYVSVSVCILCFPPASQYSMLHSLHIYLSIDTQIDSVSSYIYDQPGCSECHAMHEYTHTHIKLLYVAQMQTVSWHAMCVCVSCLPCSLASFIYRLHIYLNPIYIYVYIYGIRI